MPSQVIKDANDEGWILHCRSLQNVFACLQTSYSGWCKGATSFAEALRFAWCSLEPGGSMFPAQLWSAERETAVKDIMKGSSHVFSVFPINSVVSFSRHLIISRSNSCSVGMVSAAETTATTTLEFMQSPQALKSRFSQSGSSSIAKVRYTVHSSSVPQDICSLSIPASWLCESVRFYRLPGCASAQVQLPYFLNQPAKAG